MTTTENFEYALFTDAENQLATALQTPPGDPKAWLATFNTKFARLLNDSEWMKTGCEVPLGVSDENRPTLAQAFDKVTEKYGGQSRSKM